MRLRRQAERKFVFDWDASDNTEVDYNELYLQRHELQFFGRGHLAGIDIKQQKRDQNKFYSSMLEERRTTEQKSQEEKHQIDLVKREEKVRFDDRHWSEKALAQMTERDWRIFREDFNISCKGLVCFYILIIYFLYLIDLLDYPHLRIEIEMRVPILYMYMYITIEPTNQAAKFRTRCATGRSRRSAKTSAA